MNSYKSYRVNDGPNIVFTRKSQRTPQHGTKYLETYNMTTQTTGNPLIYMSFITASSVVITNKDM